MKYYRVNINSSNKKWKGSINIDPTLFDETKKELDLIDFLEKTGEVTGVFSYEILRDGLITPITSLGSGFIAFDSNIPKLENLKSSDIQYIPICNNQKNQIYLLMHILNHIDCVDWDRSEIERWPLDYTPEIWESKRGRFFINPVLIREKIPKDIDAFRLREWDGAFNIVISSKYMKKIRSLNFDQSFLIFHELTLV